MKFKLVVYVVKEGSFTKVEDIITIEGTSFLELLSKLPLETKQYVTRLAEQAKKEIKDDDIPF